MKTFFTHLVMNQKLKLFLVLILISYFSSAQENIDLNKTHYGSKYIKSLDRKLYNLEDFSEPTKKTLSEEALNLIDPAFLLHPDLGFARHRVYDDALELIDKRQLNSTEYLLPNGQHIFSSSEKPINYIDENGWMRQINYRINPQATNNTIYSANQQPLHKTIDVSNAKTTYKTSLGDISLNQNTSLKFQNGQTISNLGLINASNYKIGENGMFISNAFEGIDAQIILQESGAIKTNFIIKSRSSVPTNAEFLIFEDIITVPEGLVLSYDESDGVFNGNESDWEGSLVLKNAQDQGIMFYQPGVIYDDNYVRALADATEPKFNPATQTIEDGGVNSDAFSYSAYRIERISSTQYKVSLIVSVNWLLETNRAYPVVIDPTTFTGNSLDISTACAVRIGGGGNSATVPVDDPRTTYGGVGCYSTTTVLPAGYMPVTSTYPVLVQAGYVSTGCVMGNSFQTFYGPCGKDPRAAGFFWFCNTAVFAGTCTGTNLAMDGILSRCTVSNDGELCTAATPPSCANQTITFTMCTQTRCTGGTGGTCYAIAGSPSVRGLGSLRVDIIGEKITSTLTGGGNICPSTATTLNLGTSFGVPSALSTANCTDQMGGTYSWTATCTGGTLGAASGTTSTLGAAAITWTSPAAPGSYTVTVTVCNTGCSAPAGTMCDSKTVTYNVGTAIAPTLSDVTVCNGQTATLTLGNTQAGYTYTWYDGGSIASPTLIPATGTSKIVGPYTNTSRQYTVRATAPCNSPPITITVNWVATPLPIPVAGPTICPNTSTTLTADCGNNCEWYTTVVGGTSVDGDGSYTTPTLTATTTYYVEFNAGVGCISARVPITVTIGSLTVNATPSAATQVCNPGTQGFNATMSGGTFTAFDDPICNNTASTTAGSGQDCSDPLAADCQAANDFVTRTVTTPTYVTNPMDANSIQSVCIQMTDGCAADTKLWLQSPSGTIFLLAGQSSKADNTGYNTCFGATATTTISNVDDNSTTSGNTFRPAGGMLNAAFIGENPYAGTGTWTLYMNDAKGGGGCSSSIEINSFCITFRRDPPVSYTWSGAPLAQLTSSTIVNPTFTAPAVYYNYTYTLTVVDKRGCSGTDNVNVFCPDPLPVVFSQFSGVRQPDGNHLLWTTKSELESDYYDILRSNDGINFESIGKVKAAGNSTSQKDYTFLDNNPRNGINYYKLKQYDNNGDFIETETIQLVNSLAIGEVLLSPNPASKSLDISFHSEINSTVIIQIVDSKGSVIETLDQKSLKGINTLKLNVDNYSNGIYNVNINIDGKLSSARFVKQ